MNQYIRFLKSNNIFSNNKSQIKNNIQKIITFYKFKSFSFNIVEFKKCNILDVIWLSDMWLPHLKNVFIIFWSVPVGAVILRNVLRTWCKTVQIYYIFLVFLVKYFKFILWHIYLWQYPLTYPWQLFMLFIY